MSCHPVIVWPPCPIPECPDQITYHSENGNLNGVGVLDAEVASVGTFRGVVGDGTFISTTLDVGNKSIIVALNSGAIAAAIPQATEATAGKAEVATQAETNAGASDTTFITPLKLQTRVATTALSGIVELATSAETVALTDGTRAVTPQGLAFVLAGQNVTQVFANAAARAAAQPDFDGQVGVQIDTEQVFTSTGLLAGNWQQSYLQPNTLTTLSAATEVTLAGNSWVFSDGATEHIRIDSGAMFFDGSVEFLGTSAVNYATASTIAINSVTVPANSILATSGTAGRRTSLPVANFLSTYDTESWDAPTGTLDRTTFDAATVTLPELGQRVAALITDLQAIKLPQIP